MAKVKFDPVTKPVARKIAQLKSDIVFSSVLGDYKGFKTAVKEHAKLAVENFELSKSIPAPSMKVPLFSKAGLNMGLNMAKVWFLNKFRIKTPAEKQLKQLAKREAVLKKLQYKAESTFDEKLNLYK